MNDLLKDLLGQHVAIWSQVGSSNARDEGKLISYDERWVKIENSGRESLYFPIANIRLLKPL